MYPLAIVGDTPTARATILACRKAGFEDITWLACAPGNALLPAVTIGANVSRIVNALGESDALLDCGHIPDREQVRIARSGFLLSELPLGDFSADRYGAPHVNLEQTAWATVMPTAVMPETSTSASEAVERLERQADLVVVCADDDSLVTSPSHQLWHGRLPVDKATANANVTWLAPDQTAWQFSTRHHQHFYFCAPLDQPLQASDWHALLHAAIEAATPLRAAQYDRPSVREHWHAGNVVFAGEACYQPSPFLREASALGLEDAWVLSRMLENYEADIPDGLAEYARYRRPRARRVSNAAAAAAHPAARAKVLTRWLEHLRIALSTRFIPEIAMQRIDWFYGYDCIRGFR